MITKVKSDKIQDGQYLKTRLKGILIKIEFLQAVPTIVEKSKIIKIFRCVFI